MRLGSPTQAKPLRHRNSLEKCPWGFGMSGNHLFSMNAQANIFPPALQCQLLGFLACPCATQACKEKASATLPVLSGSCRRCTHRTQQRGFSLLGEKLQDKEMDRN